MWHRSDPKVSMQLPEWQEILHGCACMLENGCRGKISPSPGWDVQALVKGQNQQWNTTNSPLPTPKKNCSIWCVHATPPPLQHTHTLTSMHTDTPQISTPTNKDKQNIAPGYSSKNEIIRDYLWCPFLEEHKVQTPTDVYIHHTYAHTHTHTHISAHACTHLHTHNTHKLS